MAKISNVIYCLNTKNPDNNALLNANGILSSITPDFIPGGFSFTIITTVLDLQGQNNLFGLQFIDPDDEIMINVENVPIPQNPVEDNLPNEYRGINLAMDLQNVVLKKSGLYRTRIIINGNETKDFPIYVKGKNEQ